jgi:hypothetical protein
MADIITITEQDSTDAENILEQFLTDQLPDVDFSKGGALRDFAIVALGKIFAYLRSERDTIRARQSLLLLGKLVGSDIDDAVDEILSNWFIFRKAGRYASGNAVVYFSQATDIEIPITAKFYKTAGLVFVPDAVDSLLYSVDDMLPVISSEGVTVAYTIEVPLKAIRTGIEYNIDKGSFTDYTRFNPYITRVENTSKFSGGGGVESTPEMLERSETAVTVRDLNSARSIDATLKDNFSEVEDVIVIGYGEPEMIRDLVLEGATNTRIHAGGYVDAYLRTPILEARTHIGSVGGEFTDPREGYYAFRDPSIVNVASGIIPATDFDFYNVQPGDIMMFSNSIESYEADMFIIKEVSPYGVFVSRRSPFPRAMPLVEAVYTDGDIENSGGFNKVKSAATPTPEYTFIDADISAGGDIGKYIRVISSANPRQNLGTGKILSVDTVNNEVIVDGFPYAFVTETDLEWSLITRPVSYTIGDNSPDYNNKISAGPDGAFTGDPRYSGQFTKVIQNDGRILLPERPVYRITDVSLPGAGYPSGLLDTDGRVRFPNRINVEPEEQVTVDDLEFRLVSHNPEAAQSGWQVTEVDIGWKNTGPKPDNKEYFNDSLVTITYDTISGYDSIWAFMVSTDRRILCGSVIPRGQHPVYLTLEIPYKLTKNATSALDDTAVKEALVEHVNNFGSLENIDISYILTFMRETYSEIGYVEPTEIFYQLLAPDGRIIYFKTAGEVSMDASYIIDPRPFVNGVPTGTEPPNPADTTADRYRLDEPLSEGVSDNTVRYLTVVDLITLTNLEG